MTTWLSASDYAELRGISPQAARKALRKMLSKRLSGVREVSGRGGRSGVRYEVALSSLSEDLKRRFNDTYATEIVSAASDTIGCGYRPAPNQSTRIEYRYRVIQEAIDAPFGSAERKAEVLRAAKKWREPVRTIYNWIKRLEDAGGDMNALARKLPSDAGQRRVCVSRRFDAEWLKVGFDPDDLLGVAEAVDHLICRAWASPAQRAGWEQVRRNALTLLKRDLGERGIVLPEAAFYLSQRRIMQFQADRRLDVRENDRKRWDDMKPRIRRDATGLAPMETVVMDVKPLDCIVLRADGTTTWPKMIGFMDWGTHRVFRHFVLLAKGEGVRQEHVIEAFKAMVSHPDWGFPRQLYRDNGTEFAMFDKIRAALELINAPGARTIINAKPYSGASKPIESKFATLDRFVFSQMRGWAGGDRLNKKTQTVGKPPAPYPGSFADFVAEADQRIAEFETYPIKTGFFEGRSPADWYAAKLSDGWRPVRVDPYALEAAFAKRLDRRVTKGAISIDGTSWRHPELAGLNGQAVEIALPYQRGEAPLVNLPRIGWTALLEDMPYLPGHVLGARNITRDQRNFEKAASNRRRQLKPIAPTEALTQNVVPLPGRASPAPLLDLGMSIEAREFAGARIESAERQITEQEAAARRRAREDRRTANLLREQGRG